VPVLVGLCSSILKIKRESSESRARIREVTVTDEEAQAAEAIVRARWSEVIVTEELKSRRQLYERVGVRGSLSRCSSRYVEVGARSPARIT
jgi:hypothetical protein